MSHQYVQPASRSSPSDLFNSHHENQHSLVCFTLELTTDSCKNYGLDMHSNLLQEGDKEITLETLGTRKLLELALNVSHCRERWWGSMTYTLSSQEARMCQDRMAGKQSPVCVQKRMRNLLQNLTAVHFMLLDTSVRLGKHGTLVRLHDARPHSLSTSPTARHVLWNSHPS